MVKNLMILFGLSSELEINWEDFILIFFIYVFGEWFALQMIRCSTETLQCRDVAVQRRCSATSLRFCYNNFNGIKFRFAIIFLLSIIHLQ